MHAGKLASLTSLLLVSCSSPAISVKWTDGDSGTLLRSDGWQMKFRLKDIDAPETDGRRAKCQDERKAGEQASEIARQLTDGKTVTITSRYGIDSTGRRELVDLAVDGQDVRSAMIASGFARVWDYDGGEPKPDWCTQK